MWIRAARACVCLCVSRLTLHNFSKVQPITSRNMFADSATLRPMEHVKWNA